MNLREVDFEGMEIRRYLIETRMVRRQLYRQSVFNMPLRIIKISILSPHYRHALMS